MNEVSEVTDFVNKHHSLQFRTSKPFFNDGKRMNNPLSSQVITEAERKKIITDSRRVKLTYME